MVDRYLFEKFVFEFEDEMYEDTCVAFANMAENIVRVPKKGKATLNYYPQDPHRMQFVVEGELTDNSLQITGAKMHHTSEDVWQMKLVTPIKECDQSYLVTRPDGNGLTAVRLVNEQVLENIDVDSVIEAQMVAFALDVNIYKDIEAYHNSTPKTEEKLLMKDGLVVATNFLVNNSANLTDEERESKEHIFDNIVDVCGTITMCYKYPLHMFDMDLNNYYLANIMTDFGQLKIIIPRPLFPENLEGFGAGNVIVGKALLSGDVCIYDYEKYASQKNK